MALTIEQNIELQKRQNNLLNVDAVKFYFDSLRPMLLDFNTTYHTDRELNRTIVEVMNKADSAACERRFNDLAESYENLMSCIQSKNYTISGPMRYGSDAEKKAVDDLINKINDFSLLLKYENEEPKPEHKIKDRINYKQPSNDGLMGYNLDDLSNRGPKPELQKERIPNPIREKEKYPY